MVVPQYKEVVSNTFEFNLSGDLLVLSILGVYNIEVSIISTAGDGSR